MISHYIFLWYQDQIEVSSEDLSYIICGNVGKEVQCEANTLFVRLTFNLFYLRLCKENVMNIRLNVSTEVSNWLFWGFFFPHCQSCAISRQLLIIQKKWKV